MVITVEGLTKTYGQVRALDNVSFQVKEGEVLGFLGPNGAGKTTTMRIITGFMPPTRGRVSVAGRDIQKDSLAIRRQIGYLPENSPLYWDMDVWGYLHFVSEIKGISRGDRTRKVKEVMDEVAITDVRDRTLGKLSKGYKQRVGLAQALLNDPPILILDEPTIGLDPKQIIEIRQLIKSMAGKRTIILSTHILPEVSMICNRVIIINKGEIVAVDTPSNLTARLQTSRQMEILVRAPQSEVEAKINAMGGVKGIQVTNRDDDLLTLVVDCEKGEDLRPKVAKAFVESGWDLYGLRAVEMSLEDIFIQLVTEEQGG
ncbi:MAG: ABC transporter ATP-binding protein [bacterium]